jgi:PadR family transcriptional regulator PadR
MGERKTNPPFLNGVPEMLILQTLSRGPMYGYELVQAIRAATREELTFGEGCIYPILHRLESQGVLSASKENASGRVRVVYRVTPRGKSQLAATIGNWQRITQAVNHVLEGDARGRAALA